MPTRRIFSGEFKRKTVLPAKRFSKTNILEYRAHRGLLTKFAEVPYTILVDSTKPFICGTDQC